MRIWHKQAGFTLIELIVVLIIIGVLAVSLIPRFFTAAGTSEYLYQDQLLNLLRRAQIQAMQCTDCATPAVNITANTALLDGASCTDVDAGRALCITANDAVSLAPVGTIGFDSMGRPSCSAGSCTLNVQGASLLRVCIESEGYIHPC
ncbi:prepilin-type N-terminal cleavage/methylation domain-containing protein [Rheinheimera fenheensis]|uniref:prepilin-type N-terminal cleavage/methylation domain-containing protein n=1 Tax=Rheinheimera fenheensis TaxID=3152295 RepID=UPI003260E7D2